MVAAVRNVCVVLGLSQRPFVNFFALYMYNRLTERDSVTNFKHSFYLKKLYHDPYNQAKIV